MADLIYQNIWQKEKFIDNIKHVLMLGEDLGIRACLSATYTKEFTYNKTPLDELDIDNNPYLSKIKALYPKIMGYKVYVLISGKEVNKDCVTNKEFQVYVYAMFNYLDNKWLTYEEIKEVILSLGESCFSVLPLIDVINNHKYQAIKKRVLENSEYPSFILSPYPITVTDARQNLVLTEIANVRYLKEKPKVLNYVLKEIIEFIDVEFLNLRTFRGYLVKYVVNNKIGLEDLNYNHLKDILNLVLNESKKFNNIRCQQNPELYNNLLLSRAKEYYIDFLIQGVV